MVDRELYIQSARGLGVIIEESLGVTGASLIDPDTLSYCAHLAFVGRNRIVREEEALTQEVVRILRSILQKPEPVHEILISGLATLRAMDHHLHPLHFPKPSIRWDYTNQRLIFPEVGSNFTLLPPPREFLVVEQNAGEAALSRSTQEVTDTPCTLFLGNNPFVVKTLNERIALADINKGNRITATAFDRNQIPLINEVVSKNRRLADLVIISSPQEGLKEDELEEMILETYMLLRVKRFAAIQIIDPAPPGEISFGFILEKFSEIFQKPSSYLESTTSEGVTKRAVVFEK